MYDGSWIELSRSALRCNVDFMKGHIGEDAVLSSVIKGNAYGHGIGTFLPLAEECGIRHFSVFSAREAEAALNASTKDSRIMIMGYISNEAIPWAIENGISFYVFDRMRLEAAASAATGMGMKARIHLELETGLNRTGFTRNELEYVVRTIKECRFLQLAGVATHYAGAETVSNYLRIQNQMAVFSERCRWLRKKGLEIGLRHTACSAAALTYPETIMDMVRSGIALYGFWPTGETKMNYLLNYMGEDEMNKEPSPLKRVMSWKTRIMSIHDVAPGQFVGYGNTCMTTVSSRIASIPVGYSHGFPRDLSNLGFVLVRGMRAPVAGLVNMNMTLVDVTEIPGATTGDEVVLIGEQGDLEVTVSSFSELSQYLNYEVLVQIPQHIPRNAVQ
jgi:alanine racemase